MGRDTSLLVLEYKADPTGKLTQQDNSTNVEIDIELGRIDSESDAVCPIGAFIPSDTTAWHDRIHERSMQG